jgi:hypothetical protein
MKIVNDAGIVLISLYYLFLGAYYVVYAKALYTATYFVQCSDIDCMTLIVLKILCLVLGVIGLAYIALAIVIRFHRVGFGLVMVTSAFNIVLMIIYLLKPVMFSLLLTFVLPIRTLLSLSIEYMSAPGGWEPILESGFELLMIIINIGIAAYVFRCRREEVWEPEENEEDEDVSEEELKKELRETFKNK